MIKDLPPKVRLTVIIILAVATVFLVGLAIYGATGCNIPEEIMCPAPQYNTNV